MFLQVLVTLVFAATAIAGTYKEAPPTFLAKDYSSWDLKKSGSSRRGKIQVDFKDAEGKDDFVLLTRLDLVGDAKARGFAHGALLAKGISNFSSLLSHPFHDSFIVS